MNASFPQTSGLRQELSRPRQQGGLSVDPGQEGGHPWAPGCGCGKDGRDLKATRTVGPGVSWGKGQVRKCPGGQRRPGVAGLVERDSFGRREPLPLRGPRVCKAEMLRPASGSERSLSPGSPLMAAGLAAPSKRPGWRQARRLNTSRDSSGLGQAQRVLSPNCYAASSWTTPGQQGRRLPSRHISLLDGIPSSGCPTSTRSSTKGISSPLMRRIQTSSLLVSSVCRVIPESCCGYF